MDKRQYGLEKKETGNKKPTGSFNSGPSKK
jgi:hypothetical protein